MSKLLSILTKLPGLEIVQKAVLPVLAFLKQLFGWLLAPVTVPVVCLIALSFFSIQHFQNASKPAERNRLADSLAISARAIQTLMLDTASLRNSERNYKKKYDSTSQAYSNYRHWVYSLNSDRLQREVNETHNKR